MSTLSRFLKYIQIDSPSDPKSGKIPSSDIQLNVAKCLEEEMNALGLENVHIKEGTIYGILPATPGYEGKQPVGFIAHMDTAPEFNGFGVKTPRLSKITTAEMFCSKAPAMFSLCGTSRL